MNQPAYFRLIKNEIKKMPDFDFVKIEYGTHLKVRVTHLPDMRSFFVVFPATTSKPSAEKGVQRNVKKAFKSLRTYH